jgi:hypothetical protein
MIALYSPDWTREVGIPIDTPEKRRDVSTWSVQQSVLSSPLCLGLIAQYAHNSYVSPGIERAFSAVQTVWRSERHSNLRYRSERATAAVAVTYTR